MKAALSVERPDDLAAYVGTRLGLSTWVDVDQPAINAFAELTGDTHWIHFDAARAERELPSGRTIAHGLMLLALIPRLQTEIYGVERRGIGLNCGYDRVRFLSPVPVGSRVRLALDLVSVQAHADGRKIVTDATIEIEGSERPVLVARNILLIKYALNV